MSQPYIGEIRMFGGSFPPNGWVFCDGQLMPISENDALFTLIGTTYGGDGEETFGIPDLRGRFPLHQGTGPGGTTYQMGEMDGVESVTLSTQQIPVHNHTFIASTANGTAAPPANGVTAALGAATIYRPVDPAIPATNPSATAGANSITPSGGSQPHDNQHPFTCVSFIMSLFGIFPHQ